MQGDEDMGNAWHSPVFAPFMNVGAGVTKTTTAGELAVQGDLRFDYNGNHTIYGGNATGNSLRLYANSFDPNPVFTLNGAGNVTLDMTASQSFVIGDATFGTITEIDDTNIFSAVDLILDNRGTNVNSRILYLRGDNAGNEIEATFQLMYGAQPYLRISVDDDGTTPALTAVLDIHDTVLSFPNDNTVDIGSTGSNRPKDVYIAQDLTSGDNTLYGGGTVRRHTATQTVGATTPNISTITLDDNSIYSIRANVLGMESDGSDRNQYYIMGTFYRDGGNATQQGTTTSIHTVESELAADCNFTLSGNDVYVTVTGVAAETWNWKCQIEIMKVA